MFINTYASGKVHLNASHKITLCTLYYSVVVFAKTEVYNYCSIRSTADLEAFQNHILMYASKRHAFSPPVYEARVLLAALDYNFHRNRPTMKTAEGKEM